MLRLIFKLNFEALSFALYCNLPFSILDLQLRPIATYYTATQRDLDLLKQKRSSFPGDEIIS